MRGLEMDCVNPGTYMSALNQNDTGYARDWFTEFHTLRYACGPGFRGKSINSHFINNVFDYSKM